MKPGRKMQLSEALAEFGLTAAPARASRQVTQYGSLLVNTSSRSRAHFCMQRLICPSCGRSRDDVVKTP